jgi:hypothetical protein
VSVSSSCSIKCVPGVLWVFSAFIFMEFEYLGRSIYELWTLVLVWYGDGQFVELHVFMFLVPGRKDVLFVFTPICFARCSCFINVICIVY